MSKAGCSKHTQIRCYCGGFCRGTQDDRWHLLLQLLVLALLLILRLLLLLLLLQPIPQMKQIVLAVLWVSLIQQAAPSVHHIEVQGPRGKGRIKRTTVAAPNHAATAAAAAAATAAGYCCR